MMYLEISVNQDFISRIEKSVFVNLTIHLFTSPKSKCAQIFIDKAMVLVYLAILLFETIGRTNLYESNILVKCTLICFDRDIHSFPVYRKKPCDNIFMFVLVAHNVSHTYRQILCGM